MLRIDLSHATTRHRLDTRNHQTLDNQTCNKTQYYYDLRGVIDPDTTRPDFVDFKFLLSLSLSLSLWGIVLRLMGTQRQAYVLDSLPPGRPKTLSCAANSGNTARRLKPSPRPPAHPSPIPQPFTSHSAAPSHFMYSYFLYTYVQSTTRNKKNKTGPLPKHRPFHKLDWWVGICTMRRVIESRLFCLTPFFSGFGSELAIFLVLYICFSTSCIVIIAEFDVEIFVLSLY